MIRMTKEDKARLKYMVKENHLVTLRCFLKERPIDVSTYLDLTKIAIELGYFQIIEFLNGHLARSSVFLNNDNQFDRKKFIAN